MKDRELLIFIHDQLNSFGLSEFLGSMHEFRNLIRATPPEQKAPTRGIANTLAELRKQLEVTDKGEQGESCDRCKFFITHHCHRHSPTRELGSPNSFVQGVFPYIETEAWCGDWKRKERSDGNN